MKRAPSIAVSLSLAFAVASAHAQDAVLDAQESDAARPVTTFADFWAGYDHVSGLPNNRDDLERGRVRLRVGAQWNFASSWQLGGALRVARGTDSNDDNRRNNDNERSDSIGLDQLFIRWQAAENTSVELGKTSMPLELSPLVWDQDLRPAGVAIDHSIPLAEFDRLQFTAGYFAGQHLYGDDSRIGAAQIAWRWHEGAPVGASALLGYLDFSDLDALTRQGLARTNSIVAGRLINDYRLLDLQLVGHAQAMQWPIEARIDLVRNLGADDSRNGARASVVAGDRRKAQGWELGYAYQRIQRDAVMAAFNSDDWWFHSAARGHLVWIGYGIDATWNLRLAGFHEIRDGLSDYTNRVRLDLTAHW